MSRLRRIADHDRIFFVTTDLKSGVANLTPEERDVVVDQLMRQRTEHDFSLFSYVVMPTHLHLLLTPEHAGLTAGMLRLKRFTALRIAKTRRHRGALWQARYFDFILRRVGDFWDKREYIHQNPVEAGLVTVADAWRWSSASPTSSLKADSFDLPTDRRVMLQRSPRV